MQALSYLQRNFTDQSYIKAAILSVAFCVYVSISVVSPWIAPMFGIAIISVYRVKSRAFLFAVLFGLLFFEATHGLYPFCTWIFLFVFTKYLVPIVEAFVDCKKCLNIIGAALAYIVFYGGILIISFLFAEQTVNFSPWVVFFWITFETVIAALLL